MKIIEALASILNDETIEVIGNRMRTKRNLDLYEETFGPTEKETEEY